LRAFAGAAVQRSFRAEPGSDYRANRGQSRRDAIESRNGTEQGSKND